jgi:aspartyl-tRNA(Asn)/glutamyl-tRNA(Gln) amidotransferase subunit B
MVNGTINQQTAKSVLVEMFTTGQIATSIIAANNLAQVSDPTMVNDLISEVFIANNAEVQSYKTGKITVINFLFGQVMKKAQGKANPQIVREELEKRLNNGEQNPQHT